AGGMLGGLFNALAAPVLFTRITEYPAALVLACALVGGRPNQKKVSTTTRIGSGAPVAVGLLAVLLIFLEPGGGFLPLQIRLGLMLGLPLLACYLTVDRSGRFALCLGSVLLASSLYAGAHGKPLHAERNFFGVLRVTSDPAGPFRRLVHGNT